MLGTGAERLEGVSVRWIEKRRANPQRTAFAVIDLMILSAGAVSVLVAVWRAFA